MSEPEDKIQAAINAAVIQAKIDAVAATGRKVSLHCTKCGEEISRERPAKIDERSGLHLDCPNCGASSFGYVYHELNAWLKTLPANTRFVHEYESESGGRVGGDLSAP